MPVFLSSREHSKSSWRNIQLIWHCCCWKSVCLYHWQRIKYRRWRSSCTLCVHCLNLIVQKAIEIVPSLKPIVDDRSCTVTHLQRTDLRSSSATTFKKDIDARWNSIAKMFQSILLKKDKIIQLLYDQNEDYWIASISFRLIDDLCSVLMPFKFGSQQMLADKQPSLHLVLPFLKNFRVSLIFFLVIWFQLKSRSK